MSFAAAVSYIMGLLTYGFVIAIGLIALGIVFLYVVDVTQKRDAIRHNYPVIGRFRYIFSALGEFFRQYFFAMDREELPFNRAEREWVNRAAQNQSNTAAFGSTKSLNVPGTAIFVNSAYPPLSEDDAKTEPFVIGPFCRTPYAACSLFNISGMSFGALSVPAIRALSHGAKMAGCWLNTGEGGLSRFHLEGGCDIVFQIGTAKYGVRHDDGLLNEEKLAAVAAHEQVRMFEIKLSQGAKPGKGGILPGEKVTELIAETRGIPVGQASISPNRHPEISNNDELLDFIARVREITGKPVGIKAVIGDFGWVSELCEKIHIRGIESAPDFFTLDSGDGGTGAAPMPLMDNVGMLLRESLPALSDIFHRYNLRQRITIIASGKRITPSDVAWAICAGADFVNAGRGYMFSLGCIQAMRCDKNTCPTGVTTHRKDLQAGLDPNVKKHRVADYCRNLVKEVEIIAHSCGVTEPRQLGRRHVRVVQDDNRSMLMSDLFPRPDILQQYRGVKMPPSGTAVKSEPVRETS